MNRPLTIVLGVMLGFSSLAASGADKKKPTPPPSPTPNPIIVMPNDECPECGPVPTCDPSAPTCKP